MSIFISGLMVNRGPFIVSELGRDVDPFMLDVYAALSESASSSAIGRWMR